MATRRCKKSGRLKRQTKSGRKCRKVSGFHERYWRYGRRLCKVKC